ncbi:MAG TPA: aspartate aminotransferase family protein [Thiolapillus brandeum]|uniref:Aspartate aminotransferase family protein n=1 Tax=Thiolapillus brandeum TaxID=1076588 RepID=A0A831W7F4_9GAMM|nr:aspartate aminotransferase family protein [Thiolapillus brandeum]
MLETEGLQLLETALNRLGQDSRQLPAFHTETDHERIGDILNDVADRLKGDFPYPHPLYAGQMMKPPHPVARLAYSLTQWINPNNHSPDGGRTSSALEREAVADIAGMFGWEIHQGHLCSSGTIANLEALWIAARLRPGKTLLASGLAHYTHSRISRLLGVTFDPVPVDANGKMELKAVQRRVERGDVGTLVVTLGTTGTGSLDPLPELLALKQSHDLRIHVDAAYGGYFTLVKGMKPGQREIFDALKHVDSIVIDPHKHGLQPYGCSCVLFRDPDIGPLYLHESPYTYPGSDQPLLGEISLECSRPGAAAVALWATQKLLPLHRGGEFSRGLACSMHAAQKLYDRLQGHPGYLTIFPPELDIVVWAPRGHSASSISQQSQQLLRSAAEENLYLSLVDLPASLVSAHWPEVTFDQNSVTCLRSCLMKPEHLDWGDAIWNILHRARG